MKENNSELTDKQRRFVDEYIKSLDAAKAARDAGYSERTAREQGWRMLRQPNIAQAIAEAKTARAKRTQIDQDWIVKKLVKNIRRAMQEEAVLDRDGNETGVFTYQGSVVNQALALLAKHTGGFSEKVEVSGKDGAPIVVQFVRESHKRTAG